MKRFNYSKISMVLSVFVAAVILGSIANAELNFGTPVNLDSNINCSSIDAGPVVTADGRTMYFASDRPGGYGGVDIYVSTRASKDDPWGPAVNLGPTVNSSENDCPGSISADGMSLYLGSKRSGGYGGWDLWVTTRATTSSPWGTPVNLGSTLNRSSYQEHPVISNDGLSLYFSSDQSGTFGGLDLYVATRSTTSSSWGTPVNLGDIVNSSSGDYQPSISTDGLTLFFVSTRPGGFGPVDDIYVSTRASVSDPWGLPVNLGPMINTPAEDFTPWISVDGSILYLTSNERGGHGWYDIFEAPIYDVPTCGDANHPYPVGDFNKDCHVDVYDFLVFIDHWLNCTAPECDETP
ncbi:MAG: PD40 domain-containing protein [Sedimentisphaerales bacterium]|nr:PD40 domain-containing protein [Sedimentisphaerales bacterium]